MGISGGYLHHEVVSERFARVAVVIVVVTGVFVLVALIAFLKHSCPWMHMYPSLTSASEGCE